MASSKRKLNAAIIIQKTIRGALAKKYVAFIRLRNHRQKLLERYSGNGLYRFYFEQQGAAIRIQRWFKATPQAKAFYWKQKEIKFIKVRHGKATAIQRIVRGVHGRKMAEIRRIEVIKARDTGPPAATKIASLIRRFLTRCRLPESQYEKLLFVVKDRPYSFRCLLMNSRRNKLKDILLEQVEFHEEEAAQSLFLPCGSSDPIVSTGSSKSSKSNMKPNSGSTTNTSASGFIGGSAQYLSQKLGFRQEEYGRISLHRKGVCYPHLRVLNADHVDIMHVCARIIQAAFKAYLTSRFLKNNREAKKWFAIKRICCFCRTWNRRHKLKHAVSIIKPVWKSKMAKHFKQVKVVTSIQSFFRRQVCMRNYVDLLFKRGRAARIIQHWAVRVRCRRERRNMLLKQRFNAEYQLAGAKLYQKSEKFQRIEVMWSGTKPIPKQKGKAGEKTQLVSQVGRELPTMFGYYGSMGMIDMNRTTRMMKDCKGLMDHHIDAMQVELLFTKLKYPTEKRLEYSQFVDMVFCLATIKFSGIHLKMVDPTTGETPGSPGKLDTTGQKSPGLQGSLSPGGHQSPAADSELLVGLGSQNSLEEQRKILEFSYGRLTGKQAYICKFIDSYISTLSEYQRACSTLKRFSSAKVAEATMLDAVVSIQRQMRRKVAQLIYQNHKKQLLLEQTYKTRLASIVRIQSLLRMIIHRHRAIRLAQTLYMKYIDPKEKREYWFNPKSKQSMWVKPRLLGHLDCGAPIQLPNPKEEFVVLCSVCLTRTSNTYCDDCDDSMCAQCFADNHKAGQRKLHKRLDTSVCVQCEYQVGSRYCTTCEDHYCDTCFKYMHRKGRLKLHIFKWMCASCENCEDRGVQWDRCSAEDNFQTLGYCTICCWKLFGNPKKAVDVTPHHYLDFNVVEFRRKRQEALEEKQKAETYVQRMLEMKERKRQKAALTIQRVFRGYVKRRQISYFLKLRHEFLDLRELEMPIRESAWYIILEYFGYAPPLKSDTVMERAQKLFPGYMRHIISACIEDNWKIACNYIRELDAHSHHEAMKVKDRLRKESRKLSSKGATASAPVTFRWLEALINVFRVWKAQSNHDAGAKRAAREKRKLEQMVENYRTARSGMSEEEKKEKYEEILAAQEELELVNAQVEELENLLRKAQADYDAFAGPSSFPKLIANTRKNGVLLPFTVNVYKGSPLVLTVWKQDEVFEVKSDVKSASDQSTKNTDAKSPPPKNKLSVTFDEVSVMTAGTAKKHSTIGEEASVIENNGKSIELSSSKSNLYFQAERWRKKLREGDHVIIKGIHFVVANKSFIAMDDKSSTLNASKLSSLPTKSERKSNAAMSVMSDDTNEGTESYAPSKQTGSVKSGDEDDKEDDNLDDLDEDDEEIETGSRDEEMGVVEVVDTPEHIRMNRCWILDSEEGVEIYKMVPKAFFERQIFKMERNLQKMYAFQKGCAIMAITKHKQGRLNDTIGGFFDEESSIGNWFRSHNKYEQRDNWLKYSYSTVEMSYDFSFRRKCGRSLIRTGRTIRSIANNVVRVIAKFKKENQSREMTPYEKWQGSANKSNVIVMYKKDKHLPGTTLGDLRVDLQAPLDIMREYIQRNYRDKLNQTCGDSFEFFIELKNGKSKLLDRTKEPGTYSEDFAPFIMNHSTMVGAATIIIVAQDNVKPKIIPEFIDEAFDDGSTVGGDGSTAPGDGKGTDERPGTAGTSGTS